MRLVKIVRSRIGRQLGDQGAVVYKEIEDRREVVEALHKKLGEEMAEYMDNPSVDELADLYAVIQGLAHHELGVRWGDVVNKNLEKSDRKGDFEDPVGMYVGTQGRID
jgi:predicted house-cleaning noncanonical NTP pyrophosphatase (MazG superfamily)